MFPVMKTIRLDFVKESDEVEVVFSEFDALGSWLKVSSGGSW